MFSPRVFHFNAVYPNTHSSTHMQISVVTPSTLVPSNRIALVYSNSDAVCDWVHMSEGLLNEEQVTWEIGGKAPKMAVTQCWTCSIHHRSCRNTLLSDTTTVNLYPIINDPTSTKWFATSPWQVSLNLTLPGRRGQTKRGWGILNMRRSPPGFKHLHQTALTISVEQQIPSRSLSARNTTSKRS